MQQPLVSVITPFKNTEKYLSECIESLIGQTYANWELIAINDHSTDNSYSIVEEYAKKDGRIKLFDNDGNGIIEALRTAFKQCSVPPASWMVTHPNFSGLMEAFWAAAVISGKPMSSPRMVDCIKLGDIISQPNERNRQASTCGWLA